MRSCSALLHSFTSMLDAMTRLALLLACYSLLVVARGSAPLRRVVTPQCAQHVLSVLQGDTKWALQMLDASTKLPDGIMAGNINQLGNFDECLSVHVEDDSNFQGKYCRALLQMSFDKYSTFDVNNSKYFSKVNLFLEPVVVKRDAKQLTMKWALCVPSSCSSEEVELVAEQFYPFLLNQLLNEGISVAARVGDSDCSVLGTRSLNAEAWAMTLLGIMLGILMIVATLLDRRSTRRRLWCAAFSIRTTLRQLFTMKEEASGSIACLHGLRVGSLLWIILGHRFSGELAKPLSNLFFSLEKLSQPIAQTLLNGFLAVDTFFFMSGFLLAFTFLKDSEKNTKFNPINFYVYRYLRVATPMLAVIFFYASVLPYLGNGPMWNEQVQSMTDNCVEQWWINALFVQNFVNTDTMCLPHSWYLAVDMQLSWLAPPLLLLLVHATRAGLLLLLFLAAASCIIPFIITYIQQFPWTYELAGKVPLTTSFYKQIYMAPYSRATPYILGIFAAYIIIKARSKDVSMPRWLVWLGWLLCTATCLAVIYTLSIAYQPDYVYSAVDAAFYASFHRLGWSLGLTWIVFACVLDQGGPVQRVLAWRYWQPVSRLAFGAYLVQYIVFSYDLGTLRNATRFTYYNSVHEFFGDLPMIFALAIILYVAVEAPLMYLLRALFKKASKNRRLSTRQLPDKDLEANDEPHRDDERVTKVVESNNRY